MQAAERILISSFMSTLCKTATAPAESYTASLQCPEVKVKVASTRADREGAFQLAYESYLLAGLCGPTASRLRVTPYQLLASTDVFVAELRGEVISTLSLVRDGELGLPLEAIYQSEVNARRTAGIRVAEVSCLADRRKSDARFFGLFCDLCRVMVQMAELEGIQQLLIAVHPRHARMYCRAMGFNQVGDYRDYPAVKGNPAVGSAWTSPSWVASVPTSGSDSSGARLPGRLRSQPINDDDRRYFSILSHDAAKAAPGTPVLGPLAVTATPSALVDV